jgi:PAS domain S-box-containing protein
MDFPENIKSEEIFKNLFEHSVVGMSITSLDGRLFANAAFCKMIGYSKEELTDRKWVEYTHPDDVTYNLSIIENILKDGKKSFRWEKRYIHKDGSTVWGDIHTFLHRDDNGNPIHFITTINDITAKKEVEEEIKLQNEKLQQSNAEKDKFFSIIAHDLRSPLSSFLGMAEVMAEDIHTMTMSEIEGISRSLYKSASNLFQLLENLLEWSLLRRGISEYHSEKIALNQIILRSIDPILESAKRKNIAIKLDLPQTYFVNCDLKMTEAIFRNLISNALKYTNPEGTVVITAEPISKEEIKVSVTDTGIGMSKEIICKLFLLNDQINRKGTDGESSSGLGLLICKEFVEKQGGVIWAEGEEDRGSSFHFTLKQVE